MVRRVVGTVSQVVGLVEASRLDWPLVLVEVVTVQRRHVCIVASVELARRCHVGDPVAAVVRVTSGQPGVELVRVEPVQEPLVMVAA